MFVFLFSQWGKAEIIYEENFDSPVLDQFGIEGNNQFVIFES